MGPAQAFGSGTVAGDSPGSRPVRYCAMPCIWKTLSPVACVRMTPERSAARICSGGLARSAAVSGTRPCACSWQLAQRSANSVSPGTSLSASSAARVTAQTPTRTIATTPCAIFMSGPCSKSRCRHRQFADGQIDDRRAERQRHVCIPHPAIVPEAVERDPTEPCAEKAADLVGQEREPEEGREVTDAEELGDEPRSRRDGREPGRAQHEREQIERQR